MGASPPDWSDKMAEQKPLFDLSDLPPVKPSERSSSKKKVYVIYRIDGDGTKYYFHSSGADFYRWIHETSTLKPKRYTYTGAKGRIKDFSYDYSRKHPDGRLGFERAASAGSCPRG